MADKMTAQICKQCGELKPTTQFRRYYNGRRGLYKTCKTCEKINSREKYLRAKEVLSEAEEQELSKIHELYDAQRAAGFQPPRTKAERTAPLTESLDDMISKYKARVPAASTPDAPVPAELQKWLTETLFEEPEYYQDTIYEALKEKYRPVLKIDQATMLPVYDDTYASVLEAIADRFDTYEDEYYEDK